MQIHDLKKTPGSAVEGKRKGRGIGSGNGKTAGRGHKGQKSRSGGGVRAGFEGGQMPLARRLPKRGFVNIFAKPPAYINLYSLNRFENGETVDAEALKARGIVKDTRNGVKVLGNGKLARKLTVRAAAFSEKARRSIEEAGGKAEVV